MSHQPKFCYTRKRRHDAVEIEEKLKKLETEAEAEEEITFQTKLTDVNDDCLEKIFMLLSHTDLINIAHTNKQLKNAADMAFERKFGKKSFKLCYIENLLIDMTFGKYFKIHDLKISLLLLRCFGHLITDLSIGNHKRFRKNPNLLFHYINQYCSQSLTTISFHHISENVLEKFIEKIFRNIETVKFVGCAMGKRMSKLNTWFPAMRSLTLDGGRFTYRLSIEKHFPQLQQLQLFNVFSQKSITPFNLTTILQLNPQLRRLSLIGSCSSARLRNASKYLPMLEHLTICDSPTAFPSGNSIHFKSVTMLEITVFACMEMPRINLAFDHLEEVEMDLSNQSKIDGAVEFFKRNQSVTKLKMKLSAYSDASKDNMMEVVAVLPMLNDFTLHGHDFSVEETIQFLAKFNLLTNFSFSMSDLDDFNELQSKLGDQWSASACGKHVGLKRKT